MKSKLSQGFHLDFNRFNVLKTFRTLVPQRIPSVPSFFSPILFFLNFFGSSHTRAYSSLNYIPVIHLQGSMINFKFRYSVISKG